MSREMDTPLSGGDSPPHVPRHTSPLETTDPFSTAQPPRFYNGRAKTRWDSHDPSAHTNVVAISLLTSPLTSSLYTRNSSDIMQHLPSPSAATGEPAVGASYSSHSSRTLPTVSLLHENAAGQLDGTGLRYRGNGTRTRRAPGHVLTPRGVGGATGRRSSAVTVLSSDMGDDSHTQARRHRAHRQGTGLLPFANPFAGPHGHGTSSTTGDTDLFSLTPDDANGWTELGSRAKTTCAERVRHVLYPKSADVGIEGAEALIGKEMMNHRRRSQHARARYEERWGDSRDDVTSSSGSHPHKLISLANKADEGFTHVELPVAAVLEFTAQQRRKAEFCSGFCWYLPVLVVVTLFVLFTAPQGTQVNLTVARITSGLDDNLDGAAKIGQDILLEAMRIDTEEYSNNSRGNFMEGGSATYPWMYTHYNATINSWTPQPDANPAVDAQITRVAGYHRSPTLVDFRSLRTKRDVMRWLKNVFLPRMWDCQSPSYERPWLEVLHGSERLIGAARLTARRRAVTMNYANSSYKCKRTTLAGLDVSCQAGSGTERHTSAAPPLVPSAICNRTNPSRPEETLFQYHDSLSGYVAQLPFSASCMNVQSTLNYMATNKESILWPPHSREYAHMTELWSEYEMDTSAVESCNSFFFHRSVTELELEFVTYAGAQNSFLYTRAKFSFAATGSVVMPTMRIYDAPALAWDSHFAEFGISIVVVMVVIVYAVHCVAQFVADYRRASRHNGMKLAVGKDASLRGLAAAVQRLLRLWPIVGIVALALSVAAAVTFWVALGRVHSKMALDYAARNEFPSEIANLCLETHPVYRRIGVAALFFVILYVLRFVSVFLGPGAMMEAMQASAPRILTIVSLWFFVSVGTAVCGRMLFGGVVHEFSSFSSAYTTLLLLFVDRCRFLFTQAETQSDRNRSGSARSRSGTSTAFDATLPSVRGSSLGLVDPSPMDTKRRLFEGTNSPELHVFLLFVIYVQFFFLVAVIMAILMEAFRQTNVALHMSRMPLTLTVRHFRRALSLSYAKESLRRLLWGRRPALLLDDIAFYVSLTDTAMQGQGSSRLLNARTRAVVGAGGSGRMVDVLKCHLDAGPTISYAGVLWRFPREFQAEFGAMHLRQWWLLCVDSVRFLHHNDTSWLDEQLTAYYDAQPSGLRGWLKSVAPALSAMEARAFAVDAALEELPHKIVRYVELEMQETPPLRSADARW